DTSTTGVYILSLHDALPISKQGPLLLSVEAMTIGSLQKAITMVRTNGHSDIVVDALCIEQQVMPVYFLNMLRVVNQALLASSLRSEEHTSELLSRGHLVCRL